MAVAQLHSAPHEQSLPHWQLAALEPELQAGPQLQTLLLLSVLIEISGVCGLDNPYLPGGALRHLNKGATLFGGMPPGARTCAGKCG